MSGPLTAEVSSAAARHAAMAACRAKIAAWPKKAIELRGHVVQDSLPGRTWRALTVDTRKVLLVLATDHDNPETVAPLPWESLSDADKGAIAAKARSLLRELRDVASLF